MLIWIGRFLSVWITHTERVVMVGTRTALGGVLAGRVLILLPYWDVAGWIESKFGKTDL